MFFKATAFGLLKNLVHVSVGASLSQFNQVSQSPTQLTLLLFSLFMGLGVTFYLWKYVQRILVLDAHERGGTGGGGGVEGGVVVVGSSQGGGGGGGVGERGRLEERGGFEGDPGSLRWQ
ncbi:hypothetical protein HMI56_000806 [Coelomomyces lativittatus]|nr:hypothetical protein HMI56_000806 [Coelomomyces lativittatus]